MDGYIFFYEDKDLSSVIFLSEESGIESEELNYLSILEITEKYSNYYFIVGAKKTFQLPSNIKSRDKVTISYDRILESYPPQIPVLNIEKAE
ncbi:DUF3221 domain-containing protein [Rummeliibacillus sp. TYF005]|uniref:DUF3221 domain-containing protein n=1 Tax=Rummeliibacillus sp. TYF005 TaxID=2058214 RepID=UPI0013DDBD21|nr:DUF3221 domain-containing protein [Rummeliibacillus sp. TYF005]